jgi:hypothetical protein
VLVEDGAESGAARPIDRRWGRGSTRGREAEPVLIRHSLQQARSGSGGGRRWRVELRQGRERALDLMRDSSSDVEKRRGGAGGELNGRPARGGELRGRWAGWSARGSSAAACGRSRARGSRLIPDRPGRATRVAIGF